MAEKIKKPNTPAPKLVVAHAKSLRISPRKMRLVTGLIKNMRVSDAIVQLQFTDKKAAPMLVKLIKSAVANGEHNFQIDPQDLYIKSVTCDMGQTMTRYFPRARGSAFVIRRKMCHVHLTLEEKKGKKVKKASRFALTTKGKDKKAEDKGTGTPDSTTEADVTEKPELKQKPIKTSEQMKMNTVAQKRRPTRIDQNKV